MLETTTESCDSQSGLLVYGSGENAGDQPQPGTPALSLTFVSQDVGIDEVAGIRQTHAKRHAEGILPTKVGIRYDTATEHRLHTIMVTIMNDRHLIRLNGV